MYLRIYVSIYVINLESYIINKHDLRTSNVGQAFLFK